MATSRLGSRWFPRFYLIVAALAGAALGLAAWWTVTRAPSDRQASRWGVAQLYTIRLTRDRIIEQIAALERRVRDMAHLPEVSSRSTGPEELAAAINRSLGGLEFEGLEVQRYDADGRLLTEIRPSPLLSAVRAGRVPADLDRLLAWARSPSSQGRTLADVERLSPEPGFEERVMVRYATAAWSAAEEGKAPEPAGLLVLRFPVSQFLSYYLPPAHLMPETYSFVIDVGRAEDAQEAGAGILWHAQERHWVHAKSAAAESFLQKILAASEGGRVEDFFVLALPRSDGGVRTEIVASVLLNVGSRKWIVGLSTPYEDAVLFTRGQQSLLFVLGGLTLAVLAVGFVLLYYQRTRLEVEASEERRAQLERLQHNYQELFAQNPTAMLVLSGDGRIVDCNLSAERLVGLARSDMQGRGLVEAFEPESIEPVWERLRGQGHLPAIDARLVRRSDGASTLVEAWGRRIGDHLILMAQDVEQRRDLERQIARLRRMDSVGSLASTLAHDFNNILGQVQILVSNLRSEVAAGSPLQEDLRAIEDRIDDASQIAANLLSFRENVISDSPVYLAPVLHEFAAAQRKLLPERIELVEDVRPDLPAAWILPHSLRRVLDNLCLNACDAMPYGGTLTIRARGRWIDPAQATDQLGSGHYCVVEVEDTGIGMSQEVQDKTFEPFFTTKGDGQGTGLGLWTIFKIIRRARGAIHVKSEPGKGTKFTIYLPNRKPTEDVDSPGLETARPER
jgi:PAS domain S-box-containing protein